MAWRTAGWSRATSAIPCVADRSDASFRASDWGLKPSTAWILWSIPSCAEHCRSICALRLAMKVLVPSGSTKSRRMHSVAGSDWPK